MFPDTCLRPLDVSAASLDAPSTFVTAAGRPQVAPAEEPARPHEGPPPDPPGRPHDGAAGREGGGMVLSTSTSRNADPASGGFNAAWDD